MNKYVKPTGDNAMTEYVNYAVEKRKEGRYRLVRFLAVVGYVVFALLYICLFTVVIKAPTFIAVLPVLIWILVYFTWLYVSVEYEYTVSGGVFKLCEVFGGRYCRTIAEVRVRSMTVIAPFDEERRKRVEKLEKGSVAVGVSSMSSPDIYCGIYKDDSGAERAVLFEATAKTLKVMKYYNSSVVVAKTTK